MLFGNFDLSALHWRTLFFTLFLNHPETALCSTSIHSWRLHRFYVSHVYIQRHRLSIFFSLSAATALFNAGNVASLNCPAAIPSPCLHDPTSGSCNTYRRSIDHLPGGSHVADWFGRRVAPELQISRRTNPNKQIKTFKQTQICLVSGSVGCGIYHLQGMA